MNETWRRYQEHHPEADFFEWIALRLQYCAKAYERAIQETVASLEKAKCEMMYFAHDLRDVLEDSSEK